MVRAAWLLLVLVSACGGDGGGAGGGSVAGTWQEADGKASLALKDDGTFQMQTKKNQNITGTWKLEGDKISLTGKGGSGDVAGTFRGTVKGGEIHLQFGPTTSVYRKQ